MNITLLLGFDVSEWKWKKNEPGSQLEKNSTCERNNLYCMLFLLIFQTVQAV